MMAGSLERQMVLKMLQEGRITAEEAEELLEALDKARASRPEGQGPRPERGRPCCEPELDLGGIGRGIREAMRGFTEGFKKFSEQAPWGDTFGTWFRDAFGSGARVTVEREISVPVEAAQAPARVVFRATSGDVSIRGSDEPRIRGTAHIKVWGPDEAAARRIADELHIFTERKDDALEISLRPSEGGGSPEKGASTPPRYEVRLELAIPRAIGLRIESASGDISVTDIAGDVELVTASGDLKLSALNGALKAQTASGDVEVKDSTTTSLEATTASGDVAISVSLPTGAKARVQTASGDVSLRLAPDARVRIEAAAGSGEVRASLPLRVEELKRSRLVGVLNAPDASVSIGTASGDILIESSAAREP